MQIAVGGENLIDHVTVDGVVTAKPGGSPFNVALALGRQKASVTYVSPISTDTWGDALARTLTMAGTSLSGGRSDRPTTMARVIVTDGIPSYNFERDGTAERAINAAFLEDKLSPVSAVHTGSLALTEGPDADAWEAAMADAYDAGKFVTLDPNVRLSVLPDPKTYRDRIMRMIPKVDLLKLSDEDLEGLFPDMSQKAGLDLLLQNTAAKLVVLTKGPDGAAALFQGQRFEIEAPPVANLVDTVGAGDTFMATLIATLASKGALDRARLGTLPPEDIVALLKRAARAAAINCGREGCDPPTLQELDQAEG